MATLGVTGFDGSIEYKYSSSQSHDYTDGQAGGGGGISGSGPIWSSTDQIIWVNAGGVKYPIHLKPGWNDVQFWIPTIYPQDGWVQSPIVIEAPGYILIPGGFEWGVITGIGAHPSPMLFGIVDSVTVADSCTIIFESPSSKDINIAIADTVVASDSVDIVFKAVETVQIAIADTVVASDNFSEEVG